MWCFRLSRRWTARSLPSTRFVRSYRRASSWLSSGPALLAKVAPLVISAVLLAPDGAAANSVPLFSQSPLFSVGVARCTFVDHSRHVVNYSTRPYSVYSPRRTLVTEIRYPTVKVSGASSELAGATPVQRTGGFPMIVFAHGYDVTPDIYKALLDSWTSAGFVVVAPLFPDEQPSAVTAQHGVNTEDDLVNEPADIAFVTKEILLASAGTPVACPIVKGLVQSSEIALAGHSDGATAVGMLAYDHGVDPQGVNYASLRTGIDYRAVMILSGDENTYQPFANEVSRPSLLIIHSLADQCNPIRNGVRFYDDVHQPNKWFLELRSAHHLPPFDGADPSAFRAVVATSIRFLQMSLLGALESPSLVTYGNQQPSTARMFSGGLGPSVLNAPKLVPNCGLN